MKWTPHTQPLKGQPITHVAWFSCPHAELSGARPGPASTQQVGEGRREEAEAGEADTESMQQAQAARRCREESKLWATWGFLRLAPSHEASLEPPC